MSKHSLISTTHILMIFRQGSYKQQVLSSFSEIHAKTVQLLWLAKIFKNGIICFSVSCETAEDLKSHKGEREWVRVCLSTPHPNNKSSLPWEQPSVKSINHATYKGQFSFLRENIELMWTIDLNHGDGSDLVSQTNKPHCHSN